MIAKPVTIMIPVYTLDYQRAVGRFVVDGMICQVYKSPTEGYVVLGKELGAPVLDRIDFWVYDVDGWYRLRGFGQSGTKTAYPALHFRCVDEIEEYVCEDIAWRKLGLEEM